MKKKNKKKETLVMLCKLTSPLATKEQLSNYLNFKSWWVKVYFDYSSSMYLQIQLSLKDCRRPSAKLKCFSYDFNTAYTHVHLQAGFPWFYLGVLLTHPPCNVPTCELHCQARTHSENNRKKMHFCLKLFTILIQLQADLGYKLRPQTSYLKN